MKPELYDGMLIEDPRFFEINGYRLMDIGYKTVQNFVRIAAKEREMSLSDLARLVGESRMQINNIASQKVVPNIEIVLKLAFTLNKPISDLFSLSPKSWYFHATDNFKNPLYYNMFDKTVCVSRSKSTAIESGKYEYYDTQENRYVVKNEYNKLMRMYKREHTNKRYTQIAQQEGNKLKSNELKSSIATTLEHDINQRYVQVYKKIVVPYSPIQLPESKE
ncbi:helix-turn-helix transcriptional regulator [Paenibacillus sp. FSL L8-0499]|uniref:helix-turn-helix transcriptional regulator n=1 Tax=Paenibacillus sp. FSL L8-0499 TaxID=2975334 RepID=UPI0030F7188A